MQWSQTLLVDILDINVNDATFINVSGNTLSIADLSDPGITPGTYYVDVTFMDANDNIFITQVTLIIQA